MKKILPLVFILLFFWSSAQDIITGHKAHIVRPGETFYGIAVRQYGLTVEELYQANPEVGPKYKVVVGQELSVPIIERRTAEPPAEEVMEKPAQAVETPPTEEPQSLEKPVEPEKPAAPPAVEDLDPQAPVTMSYSTEEEVSTEQPVNVETVTASAETVTEGKGKSKKKVEKQKQPEVHYRRSSLYTLMVDNGTLPKAAVIKEAFVGCPIPEKFNNHILRERAFNPSLYEPKKVVAEEKKGSAFGKSLAAQGKGMASSASAGLIDTTNKQDLIDRISAYLETRQVAKAMVAKWFNRSASGGFNMRLIQQRGHYDASDMSAEMAKKSARGLAMLGDAGEELIGNSFVVVNDFKYISKEELAAASKKAVGAASGFIPGGAVVNQAASMTADVLAKGYVVKTTSYLYRLKWNDEIAATFYNDLWINEGETDENKKAAFEKSTLFQLEFIGSESAWADVQSTSFSKKTEEDLTRIATVKAVDAAIAKLQRKYEAFRTKTPLYSTDPLTAKIGLKEGIEPGDKFELLEQTVDPKTGKTKYVAKGVIKVDKTQIWDNRFNAGEEAASADGSPKPDRTLFVGGKKFYPGMLMRQIN